MCVPRSAPWKERALWLEGAWRFLLIVVFSVVAFCVRYSSLLAVHNATLPGELLENAIGYKWYASGEAFVYENL